MDRHNYHDHGGSSAIPHESEMQLLQNPLSKAKLAQVQVAPLDGSRQNSGEPEDGRTRTDWTPFFLRRWTLAIFLVVFAVILIVLEVLYNISERNRGLVTAQLGNRYLWTYGPTAVFVILAAFWGQVDYRARQLMPWQLMARAATPAANSLLLDYVSAGIVFGLFKSLKRSHYLIVLVISGSLLLQLATVFSTGLFLLENVQMEDFGTPIETTSRFDGSDFDSTLVDSRPVHTVYAIQHLNLSFPAGTNDRYAVQTLTALRSNLTSNTTLRATVDAFSADLDCETGQGTFEYVSSQRLYNVNITTPTCEINNIDGTIQQTGYVEAVQMANCTNLPSENDTSRRLVIVLGIATGVTDVPSNPRLQRISHLVCTPKSAIERALISFEYGAVAGGSVKDVKIESDENGVMLEQVSASDVASGVVSALDSTTNLPTKMEDGAFLTLFTLIGHMTRANMSTYLDPEQLFPPARQVYRQVAAQLAHQYLMVPSKERVAGTSTVYQSRLQLRPLSLRLTEAILGALILVTAILVKLAPIGVVSRDPGPIAGLSTILGRSPDVVSAVKGLGASPMSAIRQRLAGKQYRTMIRRQNGRQSFSIELAWDSSGNEKDHSAADFRPTRIRWWQPLPLTLPVRALVLACPMVLIATLEAVYQLSQRRGGIANVNADGYVRYTWSFVPALVMVGTGLLFEFVTAETKVFQPYYALRKGGASASRSILDDQHGKVVVHSLWSTFRKRQFPVFFATLAMLLASFLTIVVSGLYVAENVPYTHSMGFRQLSWFNTTTAYLGTETRPSLTASLLVGSDISYPLGTFDQLAFPQFEALPAEGSDEERRYVANATLTDIRIPAIRGRLNCSVLAPEMFNSTVRISNTTTAEGEEDTMHHLYLSTTQILPCQSGLYATNAKISAEGYFGRWYDMNYKPTSGCPAAFLFYGRVSQLVVEEITVLTCAPYVEQVETQATFRLPGYTIDPRSPPKPIESTARFFSNKTLIELGEFLPILKGRHGEMDGFFSPLVYGKQALPPEEMAGPENTDKLIRAVENFYGILVAQVFDTLLRVPGPPNDKDAAAAAAPVLRGTFTTPHRQRLWQNTLSTRILQGLLASMVLCVAITFWTMDTRRILPKNPSSIAAVASLMAGSQLLGPKDNDDDNNDNNHHRRLQGIMVPEGSEWCTSDAELQNRWGILKDGLFSMAWWRTGGGNDRDNHDGTSYTPIQQQDGNNHHHHRHKGEASARFGIDIGLPDPSLSSPSSSSFSSDDHDKYPSTTSTEVPPTLRVIQDRYPHSLGEVMGSLSGIWTRLNARR